jgi:hypothetical protein
MTGATIANIVDMALAEKNAAAIFFWR